MPVSRSGVMLGEVMLPNGVSIGAAAGKRLMPLPGTVWQPAQSAAVAR